VDGIAVNGDGKLRSLALLGPLQLAKDVADDVAAGAVGTVEGTGKLLEHVRLLYLQVGSHC